MHPPGRRSWPTDLASQRSPQVKFQQSAEQSCPAARRLFFPVGRVPFAGPSRVAGFRQNVAAGRIGRPPSVVTLARSAGARPYWRWSALFNWVPRDPNGQEGPDRRVHAQAHRRRSCCCRRRDRVPIIVWRAAASPHWRRRSSDAPADGAHDGEPSRKFAAQTDHVRLAAAQRTERPDHRHAAGTERTPPEVFGWRRRRPI
jgi:hypothetical protein